MIDYVYKDLFDKGSVKKDLILDFGDFQITNDKLYSESFELTESLCSQDELKFGCCEASEVKFKCRNEFGDLRGKWFTASIVLNGDYDNPFKIGRYKVNSSTPSGDKKYTDVVAYDVMYDILNTDVAEWYEQLVFPLDVKHMRNSFFMYFGVAESDSSLILDRLELDKTIQANEIPGKDVITAICELNGVFGHINRNGQFEYISLADRISDATYPSTTLYPSRDTYPSDNKYGGSDGSTVRKGKYRSCKYSDFETKYITKLQIRQESGDIGAVVTISDNGNSYIVEDNFLTYGMDSDLLTEIATELLNKIKKIIYRPFGCELRGNPCVEIGDYIRIKTITRNVDSYVLSRTLKGIQSLTDLFESKGVYEHEENVNSTNKEIKRLRGKTNKLERTVEKTLSLITDEEKGLQTQITQTAEKVESKVSKGDVSSSISQEAELIDIEGNRIRIWADNFKLDETGLVEMLSAIITGTFQTGTTHGELTKFEQGQINIFDEYGSAMAKFGLLSDTSHYDSLGIRVSRENSGGLMFLVAGDNFQSFDSAYHLLSELADGAMPQHRFHGNMSVSGTKSRDVKTESYDNRLLYCYEMPSPMFGDIGHGVIGEDGLCYVDIDLVFGETVDTVQSYQIFLQSYSKNDVHVYERTKDYFVVKGTPNTEFDWEVKAKQNGYSYERLEKVEDEIGLREANYVAMAEAYLNEYEMEVLGYE
jgi:hypothetical protein